MEIKIFSKNLKTYKLKIIYANIKIYKDNIEKPLIKHSGSFLGLEGNDIAQIEQLHAIPNSNETIELVLPTNSNNEEVILSSSRGDINLKNLNLDKLIIFLNRGNIKLEDIDSNFTDIGLVSGNIIAEIKNSIFNYTTLTKGICEQSTTESMNSNNIPVLQDSKNYIYINNPNGNTKILFKGKR